MLKKSLHTCQQYPLLFDAFIFAPSYGPNLNPLDKGTLVHTPRPAP